MKTLAVIPARGGSKSIPNKNIKIVAGKPLIAWTILETLASPNVDRLIVSTDSPTIAQVGREYGAEVPFLRPVELAQDDTPGIAPILHAARWLRQNEGYEPDYVLCLQPTSPFRTSEDIDSAIALAQEKEADSVISVTPVKHHPNWMKHLDDAGKLVDYVPRGHAVTKRQDLSPLYALNGAIYLIRFQALLQQGTFFVDNTYGYVMPPERSLDIDTPWDLHLAELIIKEPGKWKQ
jgi:CMP-N,N'-diacetyllegionaminic acid synthase